jgi:nicotinamide mononucleotide transporter
MDFLASLQESFRQFIFNTSPLEWFGVVTGTLCVWLAAKNNIFSWPIAIISVSIYIFIFYDSKLYADMGLQFYFFAMNVYGWYYWSKKSNQQAQERPIGMISKKEIILSIIGVILFTLGLGYFLHRSTDASFPFLDSFCTACSLIAQALLARRVLQNWLIWIFVDAIYVIMYFSKDLYATGIMYLLYIFIATMGYNDWKKIYHEQKG